MLIGGPGSSCRVLSARPHHAASLAGGAVHLGRAVAFAFIDQNDAVDILSGPPADVTEAEIALDGVEVPGQRVAEAPSARRLGPDRVVRVQELPLELGAERRHHLLTAETEADLVGAAGQAPGDPERRVVRAVAEDRDLDVRSRREPVAG